MPNKCALTICSRQRQLKSKFCHKHDTDSRISERYHEWDELVWFQHQKMLKEYWNKRPEDGIKNLIQDLIIHAHDLSEQ